MLQQMITYIAGNASGILKQIIDHILISFFAISVASIIGIPLGYIASRSTKSEKVVSTPFQVLRVVPSLAILVLLIPVIGVGVAPAVVALTILAIPPVIINTIVGFREVPDFMLECADGLGMTKSERLKKVQIPLAAPLILAGVRTGLVEAVASATLAAKIGAGGLGEIIFTGLGLNRPDLLILGGLLVAVLSMGSGATLDAIGKRILYYKD